MIIVISLIKKHNVGDDTLNFQSNYNYDNSGNRNCNYNNIIIIIIMTKLCAFGKHTNKKTIFY